MKSFLSLGLSKNDEVQEIYEKLSVITYAGD
jgi:hypothetical protein